MTSFLLFRLYGPLAAWGESAVGEYRPSAVHPSRSAVLGLVAAALGLERDDEVSHTRLSQSVGMAVVVVQPGRLLRDFHTAQVPPARKGFRPSMRRMELAQDDLNTVLSTRDYRVDALYHVALWARSPKEGPAFTLESLKNALECPHFVPYLGRRSCVLSLPMAPRLLEAATLREAILQPWPEPTWLNNDSRRQDKGTQSLERLLQGENFSGRSPLSKPRAVYWDSPDDTIELDIPVSQQVERSDAVFNRQRFQFTVRVEGQGWVEWPA